MNRLASLLLLFSAFLHPVALTAQSTAAPIAFPCETDCVDPQDKQRTQIALAVAGATIVALAAGIACSSTVKSKGGCCYSNYYSSSSCGDCSNTCSSSSGSCASPSSGSCYHHYDSSSDWSDSYSFWDNDSSHFTVNDEAVAGGQGPECHNCHRGVKRSQEALSATFSFDGLPSTKERVIVIPYVQLPNGSRETLGSFPLSECRGKRLSAGPYQEAGSYIFGVELEGRGASTLRGQIGHCTLQLGHTEVERERLSSENRSFSYATDHGR